MDLRKNLTIRISVRARAWLTRNARAGLREELSLALYQKEAVRLELKLKSERPQLPSDFEKMDVQGLCLVVFASPNLEQESFSRNSSGRVGTIQNQETLNFAMAQLGPSMRADPQSAGEDIIDQPVAEAMLTA